MKKNFIALLGISVVFLFFGSINTSFSEPKKETKEVKCTSEQMKEHNCNHGTKEVTAQTTKKEEKIECTEKESGNDKVEAIGKIHEHIVQLWHKDYPGLNLKKMKKDTELMLKMFPKLENSKIPESYKSKETEFNNAIAAMKVSLTDLNNYLGTISKANKLDKVLTEKVEKLHNDFHFLSGLFD
jgi:hypothetical protein